MHGRDAGTEGGGGKGRDDAWRTLGFPKEYIVMNLLQLDKYTSVAGLSVWPVHNRE